MKIESNLIESLQDLGNDTQSAVRRFAGNTDLYTHFLLNFLKDDTYQKLSAALQCEDWKAMLSEAHTLKGVAGNLGLNKLHQISADIVAALRAGDFTAAKDAYGVLAIAYQEIRAILEKAAGEST